LSEKRDLWVPAVLLLAGGGLLAWHLMRVDGSVVLGVIACVLGLAGALTCLPMRLRHGQRRVEAFGVGVMLLLAALLPGTSFSALHLVPFVLGALAFLLPIHAAPVQTRMAMLIGAAVFAILSALATMGVLPRGLTWLFVAGAFYLAVQVWNSRLRPEIEPPPGPRVCVFGGSFDPFHKGHRALAEAALRVNDRLLVVVAGAPPHKFLDEEGTAPDRTPFHHRVAMTRLGVEGLPRTEVLELEGRRSGPSYTVDTLDVLVRSHAPGTRFRLLLGADMFADFPNWKDWETILARVTLLVARRPGHELETPPELEGREAAVLGLDAEEVDVSSSAIRAAVLAGGDPRGLVSPTIRGYIRDHGLYQPDHDDA
jgi:nicotinate-nucleotide adenylyltransferase